MEGCRNVVRSGMRRFSCLARSEEGVTVFDSTGKQIEHGSVDAPWTATVFFGGKDRQTLFIIVVQNLFGLPMRVKGVVSQ
jgi:sugar lactone lactonase YvrE